MDSGRTMQPDRARAKRRAAQTPYQKMTPAQRRLANKNATSSPLTSGSDNVGQTVLEVLRFVTTPLVSRLRPTKDAFEVPWEYDGDDISPPASPSPIAEASSPISGILSAEDPNGGSSSPVSSEVQFASRTPSPRKSHPHSTTLQIWRDSTAVKQRSATTSMESDPPLTRSRAALLAQQAIVSSPSDTTAEFPRVSPSPKPSVSSSFPGEFETLVSPTSSKTPELPVEPINGFDTPKAQLTADDEEEEPLPVGPSSGIEMSFDSESSRATPPPAVRSRPRLFGNMAESISGSQWSNPFYYHSPRPIASRAHTYSPRSEVLNKTLSRFFNEKGGAPLSKQEVQDCMRIMQESMATPDESDRAVLRQSSHSTSGMTAVAGNSTPPPRAGSGGSISSPRRYSTASPVIVTGKRIKTQSYLGAGFSPQVNPYSQRLARNRLRRSSRPSQRSFRTTMGTQPIRMSDIESAPRDFSSIEAPSLATMALHGVKSQNATLPDFTDRQSTPLTNTGTISHLSTPFKSPQRTLTSAAQPRSSHPSLTSLKLLDIIKDMPLSGTTFQPSLVPSVSTPKTKATSTSSAYTRISQTTPHDENPLINPYALATPVKSQSPRHVAPAGISSTATGTVQALVSEKVTKTPDSRPAAFQPRRTMLEATPKPLASPSLTVAELLKSKPAVEITKSQLSPLVSGSPSQQSRNSPDVSPVIDSSKVKSDLSTTLSVIEVASKEPRLPLKPKSEPVEVIPSVVSRSSFTQQSSSDVVSGTTTFNPVTTATEQPTMPSFTFPSVIKAPISLPVKSNLTNPPTYQFPGLPQKYIGRPPITSGTPIVDTAPSYSFPTLPARPSDAKRMGQKDIMDRVASGSVKAPEYTFPTLSVRSASDAPSSVPSTTKPSGWQAIGFQAPKLKPGEWRCELCGIINKDDSTQCMVCETVKPTTTKGCSNQTVPSIATTSSWKSIGFKMPTLSQDEWKCNLCSIVNKSSQEKCIVCETSQPMAPSTPHPKVAPPVTTGSTWASIGFKAPSLEAGQWKCPLCSIVNTSDKQDCMVCQTSKP
ncbi:hypothetical protein IWQ61_006691 [Dispira simplex]|nr:hypothetical protein IWQ61_006691 [Dispira simplex]